MNIFELNPNQFAVVSQYALIFKTLRFNTEIYSIGQMILYDAFEQNLPIQIAQAGNEILLYTVTSTGINCFYIDKDGRIKFTRELHRDQATQVINYLKRSEQIQLLKQ